MKIGVPGHCYGLDGRLYHLPGECPSVDGACDRECCEKINNSTQLQEVLIRRQMMFTEVAQQLEDHRDYQTVVFHRDVLVPGIEVIVAIFLSAANNELAQVVLDTGE